MTRRWSGACPLALVFIHVALDLPVFAQTTQNQSGENATIEFVVRVPKSTPIDARLFIVGSPPELGGWIPPGRALVRRSDGLFTTKIGFRPGVAVEYKITRGSWETVEKGASEQEISNRVLKVETNAVVDIEVASWAATANGGPTSRATPLSRRTGLIRTHEHFKSKALSNERTLWVWLPSEYETTRDQRYPVLYMHDGQNLFDAATAFIGIEWGADETADRLIRAGKIPPIIIVGIANTPDRMSEYTPWLDKTRKSGGNGEAYAKFLTDEVKPYIDKTYRTKPDRMNTAVAGSSLGGLISLHLAMTHPETFSKCAAISPALMWADGRILKDIEVNPEKLKGVRLWFDMGTREGRQIETFSSAAEWTRRLAKTLEGGGLKSGTDYRYQEVKGGEHNEGAWSVRFDQILVYLYGSEANSTPGPSK